MISFVHCLISMRAFQHSTNPPLVSSLVVRSSPGFVGRSLVAAALAMSQVSATRRKRVLRAMRELEMVEKLRLGDTIYRGGEGRVEGFH